eukprot:198826-Prymnesium_polylepis.1
MCREPGLELGGGLFTAQPPPYGIDSSHSVPRRIVSPCLPKPAACARETGHMHGNRIWVVRCV